MEWSNKQLLSTTPFTNQQCS